MKTALDSTTIAIAVLAAVIASHAVHAQSSDAAVTRQRQVGAFSAIELDGPYHVAVHAQGTPELALTGERRQLDEIETVVRGDTLVVRPVAPTGFHFGLRVRHEVTIEITAPMLKSLVASGSGDVEIDRLGGDRFTLASNGPGELRASGAVRELAVKSSGSGNLDLHGVVAANVDVAMSGPGDVRIAGVGNELAASVSGSGDLEAEGLHAAKVTARMSGPGGVKLAGSSRELRAEIGGSGDLQACGLAVETARTVQRGPGSACVGGNIRQLDAEVNGSGDLTAAIAGKRLRLKMSGPGGARISGSVDDVSAQLSGSGNLAGRELRAGRADLRVRGPGSAAVRLASGGMLVVDSSGSHRNAE